MNSITWRAVLLGLLCALGAHSAQAKAVALLVGVGDYLDAQLDIPGVEQDLAKAEQMVQSLGVPASATVTLYNGQATVAAVEAQLAVWADQLNPGDQAYIYFSTHGLQLADQNGDEPDGRDEALALADFRVFGTGKQSEVTGVLRDDRLGELLAALPNDRTLIIADTCHSGSIGKSLDDVLSRVGKFIQMPSWLLGQGRASTSVPLAELQLPGVVLLSAAADGELADIDESGSVFTRALQESQLNPEQDNAWCWFQRARSRVRRQTAGVQWPQFSGDFIQSISPLQGEDTGMFGVALTQACSSSAGFSVSVQTTRSGASLLAQSEQPGWVTAVSVRQHRDGLRFKSSGSRWHHGRGGETRLARLSSSTSKHSGAWVFWTADGVELPRHRGDFSLMWQALQTLSVDQWASAFVREVDLHGR